MPGKEFIAGTLVIVFSLFDIISGGGFKWFRQDLVKTLHPDGDTSASAHVERLVGLKFYQKKIDVNGRPPTCLGRSATPGNTNITLSSINSAYAIVDNNNYYYHLEAWIPNNSTNPANCAFYYALVEYGLPA
jgi:hypothetical protein